MGARPRARVYLVYPRGAPWAVRVYRRRSRAVRYRDGRQWPHTYVVRSRVVR